MFSKNMFQGIDLLNIWIFGIFMNEQLVFNFWTFHTQNYCPKMVGNPDIVLYTLQILISYLELPANSKGSGVFSLWFNKRNFGHVL